ncbi:MAG: hypothetical protein Q4P66_08455 [Actinomycetaceae bacterium]|nr:hypothetical protein [Actinomycetaceae bacterium]
MISCMAALAAGNIIPQRIISTIYYACVTASKNTSEPALQPTSAFSMYVLASGLGLAILGLGLCGWLLIYQRTVVRPAQLATEEIELTLEEKSYLRYRAELEKIMHAYSRGILSQHDLYLQAAAIVRAAVTLASERNVEVMSLKEIAAAFPSWPGLADVIYYLESHSFSRPVTNSTDTIQAATNGDFVDEGGTLPDPSDTSAAINTTVIHNSTPTTMNTPDAVPSANDYATACHHIGLAIRLLTLMRVRPREQ